MTIALGNVIHEPNGANLTASSEQSFEIDVDVARAWSLPSRFYRESSIFEEEKEKIFRRTWHVVGHRDQVAKPGDYFTVNLFDEPLLFVRDSKGEL